MPGMTFATTRVLSTAIALLAPLLMAPSRPGLAQWTDVFSRNAPLLIQPQALVQPQALTQPQALDGGTGAAERPNILFINVDDMGWGTLDEPAIEMPNLDSLRAAGVTFERHYGSSICGPSRYQWLTGRYTHRISDWTALGRVNTLDEVHLGEALGRNGYQTWYVGKFGNDCEVGECTIGGEFTALAGFDYFWGRMGATVGGDYGSYTWTEVYRDPLVVTQFDAGNDPHLAAEEVSRAIVEIQTRLEPWFGSVGIHLIHSPFHDPSSPPPWTTTTCPDTAQQCVELMSEELDDLLGSLLSVVDTTDTIVILASDNGDTGEGFWDSANCNQAKGGIDDCGTRTPLVFAHGGVVTSALVDTTIADRTAGPDLYATIVALAGGTMPTVNDAGQPYETDGESLLPRLDGTCATPNCFSSREVVYSRDEDERAVWEAGTDYKYTIDGAGTLDRVVLLPDEINDAVGPEAEDAKVRLAARLVEIENGSPAAFLCQDDGNPGAVDCVTFETQHTDLGLLLALSHGTTTSPDDGKGAPAISGAYSLRFDADDTNSWHGIDDIGCAQTQCAVQFLYRADAPNSGFSPWFTLYESDGETQTCSVQTHPNGAELRIGANGGPLRSSGFSPVIGVPYRIRVIHDASSGTCELYVDPMSGTYGEGAIAFGESTGSAGTAVSTQAWWHSTAGPDNQYSVDNLEVGLLVKVLAKDSPLTDIPIDDLVNRSPGGGLLCAVQRVQRGRIGGGGGSLFDSSFAIRLRTPLAQPEPDRPGRASKRAKNRSRAKRRKLATQVLPGPVAPESSFIGGEDYCR
jgi:arylsulfatase A-like enzyme